MVATKEQVELLVIVGPTASGKSALAMRIAKQFNGEIITADSRAIYKGMDIGTAKPSKADQAVIRHWGIDLIKPGENFSAAKFKVYANTKIADIKKRGRLPILVGGTGLYIDAVLFDFKFETEPDDKLRHRLEAKNVEQLQAIIKQQKLPMPANYQNKRHLIRTIERQGKVGSKKSKPPNGSLIVGLYPSDQILKANINARAEQMFKDGVLQEFKDLTKHYAADDVVSGGIIYKLCSQLNAGETNLEQTKDLFKTSDWQYARRQRTWFKRNKFIQWFETPESAFLSVTEQLNNQIGA
ncbi:MAG TPA: tRNA (adenosine(37)-N6)-dimethylallyltransferase MiaA [Candidatus Binatia bacterium]|nr:tRNA (adenosine(37)-N6)-dimethylallyltransferase MiaA [Candidatus Binatia bacterium]